jgi:drug/metabolite transporter (DMT)-like permease
VSSTALGVGAACGASALYNVGVALQAIEARRAPASEGLRLGLLARLVRRPWWLAGLVLGIVGWPLQVAALLAAPLTVVQPALGVGLILLLPIGGLMLGERVTRADAAAVVALLGGVGLLAAVAPQREVAHAGAARTAVVLTVVAALALAPYAGALWRSVDGRLAALSAGAAFGWSGLSTKLFSDAVAGHHWPSSIVWAIATGLASGLAVLSESTALQRLPVHRTAPTVFAVQVLIPVAAAPLLVGEAWSGSAMRSLTLLAGLAAVLAAVAAIARSQAAIALTATERAIGTGA